MVGTKDGGWWIQVMGVLEPRTCDMKGGAQ